MPRRRQVLAGAALCGAFTTAGCFIPEPEGDDGADEPVDDDPDPEDDDPADDDSDDEEEEENDEEEETLPPGEIDGLHDRFRSIIDDLEWAETSYGAGVSAYRTAHADYRELVESLQSESEVTPVDVDRLRSHNDDLQAVFDGPLAPFAHLQAETQTTGWISEIADHVEVGDQDRVQDSLNGLRGSLSAVSPEEFERSDALSDDPLTSRIVTATDAPGLLKSRALADAARGSPTGAQPRPLFELRYEGAVSGDRIAYSTGAAAVSGSPSVTGTPGSAVFTDPTLVPAEPNLGDAIDIETAFEPVTNPVDRVQQLWLIVNEFLPADDDRLADAFTYDVGLLPGTPVYIQEYEDEAAAANAVARLFEGPVSEPDPVVNPEIGGGTWQGIVFDGATGPLYAAFARSGPLVFTAAPSREPLAERDPDADTPAWIQRLEWSFVADVGVTLE